MRTYTLTTAVGVAISYRTCVALCAVNFRMSAVADRVGEVVQQHLRRVLRHLPFLGESHESGSAVVAWNARTAWSMPSQGRLPRRKFSAVSLLIRRSVKCENAKPRRHESTKRSNKYRTSVFGDGRISTHADPTLGQRSGQSYIARSTPSWPGCGSRASANALGEQSSPKCEIPCPGRRWTTVQNLTPLALSSTDNSVTVHKQTVTDISTPCLSACVDKNAKANAKVCIHVYLAVHGYGDCRVLTCSFRC